MASATTDRRYTLKMNESEARTLLGILGVVYVNGDNYDEQEQNIIHLHQILMGTLTAAGVSAHVFPIGASDE